MCQLVDFAIPADHRIKIKGSEDSISTWTLLENPWNNPKDLEKRLGELESQERIEIVQTTTLLKLARILSRVLES